MTLRELPPHRFAKGDARGFQLERITDSLNQKLFVTLFRAPRQREPEQSEADIGVLVMRARFVPQLDIGERGIQLLDRVVDKRIAPIGLQIHRACSADPTYRSRDPAA